MTSKTTETASGTSTDVRDDAGWSAGDRINELNQILRRDVTPAGGSTTRWDYTFNDCGQMTQKKKHDNSEIWDYVWNDDGRLTEVKKDSVTQVKYEYDSIGRMLVRTPYSGGVAQASTRFTWDGWNCVKEDDGTNVFRWYCPQGELHSFERNSTFYQVHSDALGSVRAITDNTGAVVGSYTYGAWGEVLSASEPSGFTMPFKFVGGWGIRHEATTGLYYMRNRWYDAGLGRFLSRDALGSLNRYEYCYNDPINWVDLDGLEPGGLGGVLTRPGPTVTVAPRPIGVPQPVRGPLRVPGPRVGPGPLLVGTALAVSF